MVPDGKIKDKIRCLQWKYYEVLIFSHLKGNDLFGGEIFLLKPLMNHLLLPLTSTFTFVLSEFSRVLFSLLGFSMNFNNLILIRYVQISV